MSEPVAGAPTDESFEVINSFIAALMAAFNPFDSIQPPLGGGSTMVRFVAGDVVALELWDAHATGCDCREPFLWVRMTRRFRTKIFPAESNEPEACSLPRAIGIEIGVGRCSALGAVVDWEDIEKEARVSLDDSWRIELALCRAVSAMKAQNRLVSTGAIMPFGPEGGVVAWTSTAIVKL